ncbi:hypothetical protein DUD61_005284, partial [Geotrichum candidum]
NPYAKAYSEKKLGSTKVENKKAPKNTTTYEVLHQA